MDLAQLNLLPADQASDVFETCCVAKKWINAMVEARPYESVATLLSQAQTAWQSADKSDILQAFEGHPRIGDVASLKEKYANTSQLAGHEQAGMNAAQEAVIHAMAKANDDYFNKFGYIFIVCASGKSAEEMLAILNDRLHNSVGDELPIAAREQLKITQLRLTKLLGN